MSNTPIAIKIIDNTLEIPKLLSGKLLCTVVVSVVGEEVFVVDDVLEVIFNLDVFVELELVDTFDVLVDVFDVLEVVFSVFVSLISISTAKTFVAKDTIINNIAIIERNFKFFIIFYTSIKNKKIYLKFFTMISQILKTCPAFFKKYIFLKKVMI